MNTFRLDSVSTIAAERFRRASSYKRRKAVLVACIYVASSVDLATPEVAEALSVLRESSVSHGSLRQRLEETAAGIDEQYFQLDESGDPVKKREALVLFSRARVDTALAFSLSDDDGQIHDAIYETLIALEDPAELVRLVEGALE